MGILETALAGAGSLGVIVLGVVKLGPVVASAIKHWRNGRAQVAVTEREAAKAETVAREQGAAAVLPRIMERLDTVERRTEECEEHRDECREELHRTRGDLAEARKDIAELARRVAQTRRSISVRDLPRVGSDDDTREDTGVVVLEEISERHTLPLSGPGLRRPQRGGDDG